MKTLKNMASLFLVLAFAIALAACETDNGTSTGSSGSSTITVSGTITYGAYATGDIFVAAFTGGAIPGVAIPLNSVVITTGPGAYSISLTANEGSVDLYIFNDVDGSSAPELGEGYYENIGMTIGSSNITLDVTLVPM